MASVAAGYLPILLFLGVALALSGAFVLLPMAISRLTGTHQPTAEKIIRFLSCQPISKSAHTPT